LVAQEAAAFSQMAHTAWKTRPGGGNIAVYDENKQFEWDDE